MYLERLNHWVDVSYVDTSHAVQLPCEVLYVTAGVSFNQARMAGVPNFSPN